MNTHLPPGAAPRGARPPPHLISPPIQRERKGNEMSTLSCAAPAAGIASVRLPEAADVDTEDMNDMDEDSPEQAGAPVAVEYLGAVLPRQDQSDTNDVVEERRPTQNNRNISPPTERADSAADRTLTESENDVEEEGDTDATAFLGLFYQSGRLGCAVYDEIEAELSLLQIPEMAGFESLKAILFQVRPSLVVTNGRPDRDFEDVLKNPTENLSYEIDFAPSKDFKFDSAKARLMSLSLDIFRASGKEVVHESEKALLLGSVIDFDSKEAVSAAGGLLQHLECNKMVDELMDSFVLAVTKIKTLHLENFVHVDAQTLQSLQILHQDRHPSLYSKGRDKEGLSLFSVFFLNWILRSLLDNTKSPVGKRLLRSWFVRPLLQEEDIKQRFDSVRFFVEPTNHTLAGNLHSALRQLKDVPRIMLRVRQSVASVKDWQNLEISLKALAYIHGACDETSPHLVPSLLADIKTRFCSRLNNIVALLHGVIDFEESRNRKRIVIQEGVDDVLDEEKRNYDRLGTFLEEVAVQEVDDLPPEYDLRISVVFFPQLGYLVVSPNTGQQAPPGMTMHFNTDEWIYYKTERMRELDEKVGDIYGRICDQEWAIMNEVRDKILEYHMEVLESCSLAARLDCILGFAVAAVERDYCEPTLVQESVCYIAEGRHPLCELCVEMYVPNDTSMDSNRDGKPIVNLITGPNYSGKSVYLKQVALITFMAHLGSWVPARSCEVGLVDRIFSRVQSRESCAVPISSFAIDLNQVAVMLRACSSKSLLLIDEFGKGTQASDGIALLASTIRQLLQYENQCPRTVIATHFSELFTTGGILPSSPYLGFYAMQVMGHDARGHRDLGATPSSESATMDLVYLYRLVDGKSSTSYGYQCAQQAGLPSEIVERAKLVARQLRENEPIQRLEPEQEVSFRQRADDVVALLRNFDVDNGDVSHFLRAVSGTGGTPGSATGSIGS